MKDKDKKSLPLPEGREYNYRNRKIARTRDKKLSLERFKNKRYNYRNRKIIMERNKRLKRGSE